MSLKDIEEVAQDETFYYSDVIPTTQLTLQFVEACLNDARTQGLPETARFATMTDEQKANTRVLLFVLKGEK